MTARHLQVHRGSYRDSVRLMQVSRALTGVAGVSGALVAMATDLNLELVAAMGFPPPEAGPNDMVVAVTADGDAALTAALDRLDAELHRPAGPAPGGGAATTPPRTLGSAVGRLDATLALVSTPGRYAFVDAVDALEAGVSVMVFSDNVPVAQEVLLKDIGARHGLLVMGPDCGTAVVGGVGLGFANVVRPGPVGLVAASGTGAQQVMALLDAADTGISHCLGVGGRDLSAPVGGRSTLAALDALDADPDTGLIMVVSKPPDADVADRIREHAAGLRTPVRFAFLGRERPDLTEAVAGCLRALGRPVPPAWPSWLPPAPPTAGPGALRGLFSGGTLCDEAMVIASAALGPVASNIPLRPQWRLSQDGRPTGHTMIDFGDDAYTRGRPHPMIDNGLRLERLAAEAADPSCRVILLDVVLGHGAHPDPAGDLAPAIAAAGAGGRGPAVVVSLIGTTDDPQGLTRQATALHEVGAAVFRSNADATRHAVALVTGAAPAARPDADGAAATTAGTDAAGTGAATAAAGTGAATAEATTGPA
jgi:FdrA protein